MAKKSNKTEHVLKLIIREDSGLEEEAREEVGMEAPSVEKQDSGPEEAAAEHVLPTEKRYLINLTELLIAEHIDQVMKRLHLCTCETCCQDVFALALNALPAKYITTSQDQQHLRLDSYKEHFETDVLAALTKAGVRVKACPRH